MRKKKRNRQKHKSIKTKAKSPQVKFKEKLERSGKKVVVEPSGCGIVRMSEVLQDFAEPLLHDCVTDAEFKNAIMFSILVWNASLTTATDKEKSAEFIIEKLAKSDQHEHIETTQYYIIKLLKRKEIMFPNINRFIVDCQFSGAGSNLRFDVASTLS
jgi:hypothetical protein